MEPVESLRAARRWADRMLVLHVTYMRGDASAEPSSCDANDVSSGVKCQHGKQAQQMSPAAADARRGVRKPQQHPPRRAVLPPQEPPRAANAQPTTRRQTETGVANAYRIWRRQYLEWLDDAPDSVETRVA